MSDCTRAEREIVEGLGLAIEHRPIGTLIPYARNARTHSEEQVALIAGSIREFGFTNPVLVDGTSGIIAGHGRVLAARKLGLTVVPVIELAHLARALRDMGVLTLFDRAALAAYCQAYGRRVEAEERLRETPMLFKTPSGYVQQSPWLGIANKQLELMGRYMVELGMTPASRSRVAADLNPMAGAAADRCG